MAFPFHVISVLCTLYLLQTAGIAEADVYQPECDSLDEAVRRILIASQQLQPVIDGVSINCSRNEACDGFSCVLTLEGKATELRVKLHPCEDPPQMLLQIQSSDPSLPYFEQTVTHGDTYPIPGLSYNYLDLITLNVSLRVQFEKVADGLQIALYLELLAPSESFIPPISVPILNPMVINTPPCSTQEPGQDIQCVRMGELVDRLHPPHDFQCVMQDQCRGFSCSGNIQLPLSGASFSIMAILDVDSCTNPVSYNITLIDTAPDQIVWSHSFIRSESVSIEGADVVLPPGVSANLNVTMEPYTLDIDYLITSIVLTVCFYRNCQAEPFIDREIVPIPPCEHPLSTSMPRSTASSSPMPGASDECMTMQAIASDIMDSDLFINDQMRCHANGNEPTCDGFVCALDTRGHSYEIRARLFHCENPVRLLFKIDDTDEGYDYHLAKNITGNSIVSLDGFIEDGKIKFVLVQRSSAEIEIAVSIELPEPSGQVAIYPLVQDHLIPVGPCSNATTNSPPMTTPSSAKPSSAKPSSAKPAPNKNDVPPTKDKSAKQKVNRVAIGVGVSFAVLAVVALMLLGLLWYRRRSRLSVDEHVLVENSTPSI